MITPRIEFLNMESKKNKLLLLNNLKIYSSHFVGLIHYNYLRKKLISLKNILEYSV